MRLILLTILPLLALGCDRGSGKTGEPDWDEEQINKWFAERPAGDPTEHDLEFTRWFLAEHDSHPAERIYFLTPTPLREWGDDGNWQSFSPEFHASLKDLKTQYRRAEDAYQGQLPGEDDERVLEKETDAEGWMKWVTVLKWVSPTEVIVNEGVWCCPLGGGESITIYEKVDGQWHFKKDILSGQF